MNLEAGVQLDLLGALQRRWEMITVAAGVSVLVAYWIAMALPNYYDSSATIFVEPQAINQKLVESGVASYDIGYRVSLMSAQILSRPRLSRVIDDLELYPDESKTMLREEIIGLMRSRIAVLPVETAIVAGGRDDPVLNTFLVTFSHKDPQLAAAVAQRVANDFVKEHIEERVGMTRTSLEFIDSELDRLNADYATVQDQVTKVKNANTGSLPDDMGANQRILDRTLGELRQGARSLDIARSNKAFWDTQALSAAAIGDPRDDTSPVRRLQMLELRLAEYRSRGFTDRHPDVIQLQHELDEVSAKTEVLVEESPQQNRTPTIAQQNAEAQRERAALEVEMGVKEVERLRLSADSIEARLAETPKVAEALDQLMSRLSRLKGNVELFSRRQLEAKVQVDVERRQLGEQFNILEAAFPAPTPTSPNRFLIVVMGLLFGVAVGVAGAVVFEATDTSFRDVRGIQDAFSMPVLATIPEILLESDHAAKRRRRARNLAAAAGVALFCLGGGAVTYVYVNGAPAWLSSLIEGEPPSEEAPATEAAIRPSVEVG